MNSAAKTFHAQSWRYKLASGDAVNYVGIIIAKILKLASDIFIWFKNL